MAVPLAFWTLPGRAVSHLRPSGPWASPFVRRFARTSGRIEFLIGTDRQTRLGLCSTPPSGSSYSSVPSGHVRGGVRSNVEPGRFEFRPSLRWVERRPCRLTPLPATFCPLPSDEQNRQAAMPFRYYVPPRPLADFVDLFC